MKKIVYDNAVVYITIPNEKQIANIRKATEKFATAIVKEQILNETRRNNRRVGIGNTHARRRTK